MTKKWDEMTHDERVEYVIIEVLKRGTIERAETIFRQLSPLPLEEIQDLIDEAQMRLVSSSPPEIRGSMATVIGFHRWNAVYQTSMQKGDVSSAISAQKQIDRLLGSIH